MSRQKTLSYGLDEIAAALTKGVGDLHPTLRDQLDRVGGLSAVPAEMRIFVDAVDAAYKGAEDERLAHETIIAQLRRERSGASDELAALFGAIPDLLLRLDAEGRVLDSRGGHDQPSNPLRDAARGKLVSSSLPEAEGTALLEAARRVVDTDSTARLEWQLGKDEDARYYEARLLPLRRGELMAMVRDISAQVIAERERERAAEQQVRTEALTQFAYVASHDLQAPLRAIENLASWLEDDLGDNLTGESATHLQLLRGRVQHMQQLVKGLLEYSRVGAKGVAIESVDVAQLVRDVAELIGPREGFSVRVVGEIPTLDTSRDLLERVLLNLISNALKHHDADKGTVEVRCSQRGHQLVFRVSDDGPGIPEDKREAAFLLFKRLKTKDKDGVGMGLSLVQRIIASAGGEIRVESVEPRGACFVFSWPLRWPV